MCGRFTLTDVDPGRIRLRFDLDPAATIEETARYNIAPTDPVLAIRLAAEGEGAREPGRLRWGLVPGRWAERKGERPLINARAETIATQPAFADSFRHRRCLIPADGFYEWRSDEDGKRPIWIHPAEGGLFAFAGIWAALDREGAPPLHSCAIVTCEPNEMIRPIHDRMPVILAPGDERSWLQPDAAPENLAELLRPLPSEALATREVGDAVNDVREDGPHLLEPPLRLF